MSLANQRAAGEEHAPYTKVPAEYDRLDDNTMIFPVVNSGGNGQNSLGGL